MTTIGLLWDEYTPAVEGQITRDIIAIQATAGQRVAEFTAVCTDDSADRLLSMLGVSKGISMDIAKLFIIYQTTEETLLPPEYAKTVIVRDLYVPPAREHVLDDFGAPGYYMEPQGRVIAPSINLNRPMPSHTGPTDPLLILLWG